MTEGDLTGLQAGQQNPEAGQDDAGLGQQPRMPRWAQQRIGEITKQKHDAERAADAERAERQKLASEIAALREQIGSATGANKPKSWDDLGPDDAHKLIADELARLTSPTKNEETGEVSTADPNLLAKGIRELIRKEAMSLIGNEKKQYAAVSEANQRIERVRGTTIRDLGADATNPSSELRQKAEAIWGEMTKKYGKEGLQKRLAETPDLEYLTFSKAAADLLMEGKAQSRQTAQELEVLRRQAGVGSGGEGVAEAQTRLSTLLKRDNLDGAASELARQMLRGA